MNTVMTARSEATCNFIRLFEDWMFIDSIGPKCTCDEADAIAAMLRHLGAAKTACGWLKAHALGDDDLDFDHHIHLRDDIEDILTDQLPHDQDCPACLDPSERFHSVDRTSPEYLEWVRETLVAAPCEVAATSKPGRRLRWLWLRRRKERQG